LSIDIPFAPCVREGDGVLALQLAAASRNLGILRKPPPPEATKTVYPILGQLVNLIDVGK